MSIVPRSYLKFGPQHAETTTGRSRSAFPITSFSGGEPATEYNRVALIRLYQRPRTIQSFTRLVFVRCHISRIFPAYPRSLASVLFPRPAAHRCSASAAPPCGSGFPKRKSSFGCGPADKIFFSEPPQKAHLDLGSGTPRVASRKSVPRAIRANTNKEKHNGTLRKQSHSEGLPR
jgi:hypothetical protein